MPDFDYTPPAVSYDPIFDSGEQIGRAVTPPFQSDWDHLTTLRHFAALVEHRTGLKVRVAAHEYKIHTAEYEDVEHFDVLTGHTTGGPADYHTTWAWLSGFETGAHETLWTRTPQGDTDGN